MTHFKQIYERALATVNTAKTAFDEADKFKANLRSVANVADALRQADETAAVLTAQVESLRAGSTGSTDSPASGAEAQTQIDAMRQIAALPNAEGKLREQVAHALQALVDKKLSAKIA